MTVLAITGLLGSGKTLALTYLAFKNHLNGRKIFANYHLKDPLKYTPIRTIEDFEEMNKGVFVGDELWSWLDCRASHKKINAALNKILLRSRKRLLDVYYTAQFFGLADKRLRKITDTLIQPQLNRSETVCRLHFFSRASEKDFMKVGITKFRTKPVFDLFDTREEVEMINHEQK